MKKTIKIKTDKLFTDITEEVSKHAQEWGKSGIVNVYSKHTTFCIWCAENELLHSKNSDKKKQMTFSKMYIF